MDPAAYCPAVELAAADVDAALELPGQQVRHGGFTGRLDAGYQPHAIGTVRADQAKRPRSRNAEAPSGGLVMRGGQAEHLQAWLQSGNRDRDGMASLPGLPVKPEPLHRGRQPAADMALGAVGGIAELA